MNQGNTTSRPLVWEDEAPAESRFRRVQQGVPRTGRRASRHAAGNARTRTATTLHAQIGELPALRAADGGGPRAQRDACFLPSAPWLFWPHRRHCAILPKLISNATRASASHGTSHIQATGLTEVSRAQMLPVFGEDIGRNIFFVPLGERRRQLEAIPWVEHATVMRLLPDQIRVYVVERQPVPLPAMGSRSAWSTPTEFCSTCRPPPWPQHHYSFPVVTGIDAGDPPRSRKARMAVYGRLMAELDANGQHFSEQISEIDLTDPEDARVLMPEQGADILAHFGEDHFLERYQRYKAHIAEWRQQYPKLAAVDLRYDQQVVLEMASGAAADPDRLRTQSTAQSLPATERHRRVARSWPQAMGHKRPQRARTRPTRAPKQSRKRRLLSSSSTKAKAAAARTKAAQDKKHAQAKSAALELEQAEAIPRKRARQRQKASERDDPEAGQPDRGAGHRQRMDARAGSRPE